jgi:uncharacterized protein
MAGALALSRVAPASAVSLVGDWLVNPCAGSLPTHLANHEIVQAAWAGVDPRLVRDVHVHLFGSGDSGEGPWLPPAMQSPLHPVAFLRRLLMMNAACVERRAVDRSFVTRLHTLVEALPAGVKLMLLAFDAYHDAEGQRRLERSPFYIPDRYAAAVARRFPGRFEWIASIHPYRPDAVEALAAARDAGARAVKWLPNAMGIDPASPRCDPF